MFSAMFGLLDPGLSVLLLVITIGPNIGMECLSLKINQGPQSLNP